MFKWDSKQYIWQMYCLESHLNRSFSLGVPDVLFGVLYEHLFFLAMPDYLFGVPFKKSTLSWSDNRIVWCSVEKSFFPCSGQHFVSGLNSSFLLPCSVSRVALCLSQTVASYLQCPTFCLLSCLNNWPYEVSCMRSAARLRSMLPTNTSYPGSKRYRTAQGALIKFNNNMEK